MDEETGAERLSNLPRIKQLQRGRGEISPLICVELCPVPASLYLKKAVLTGLVAFSGLEWKVQLAWAFSCLR